MTTYVLAVPANAQPFTKPDLDALLVLADPDVSRLRRDTHAVALRKLYLEGNQWTYTNQPTYEVAVNGRIVGYLVDDAVPYLDVNEDIQDNREALCLYLFRVSSMEQGKHTFTQEDAALRTRFLDEAHANADKRSLALFGV